MHSFFFDASADVDAAAAAFLYALTLFLFLSRSFTHAYNGNQAKFKKKAEKSALKDLVIPWFKPKQITT